MMVAECFGIKTKDRKINEIAEEVGEMALMEFGKPYGTLLHPKRAPEARQKIWEELGIAPRAIDREVTESMHRTSMGGDQGIIANLPSRQCVYRWQMAGAAV